MTVRYRTKGFVFKRAERNEADQTFSIFTKDFGRLELKAKSIRKITSKLRAGIDIFYFSEIEFIQGKNDKTLTDALKIKKFNAGIKTLSQISDVLDNFIKGQEKDEKTFDLLNETFDKIDNKLAFQYFFWNFASLQGYRIEVENCADCKSKLNPYNIYFSAKDGGVVCKNCASPALTRNLAQIFPQKINSDIVKVLRLILKKNWQTVSKLKIEPKSQNLLEEILQNAAHSFCPAHC
ncbi:MAG: DNA repair protein RecO [Candidatus Staskawiczbacteria bacterium RIFOXYB1_FULL_37_44]|uniref:DNA repair protein RecO n=1 Tax=Candidatus Staskawiczbacteria bacterium RIFOXYB1_FULL_37_44 TaxID=1802223 RepID=A0A1G2IWP3_9BACT|nr:MAG: DNA repair protein RecO [Candidatus Staskawiczbacteria bacterium RIFOXYB1_FULL_37_44]OGZ83957.1 MAG: DNA repair protein RecO [Candidatus Staskawiczbacteria bacterium RIFOXYC1_FULL_37_52]OGZ87967.1 MAG: DNA repair protein RecO [Candidatus Staskawiczbacteria bacterium RIFOXYC2_FULL_37_19]OGZ89528.1 MAG: DNA repair protein RecO [Candidatus Staskawiczbacteria bacterium RIFOXYD1_FULL_37_110]